jgi:hypothetical protein
MTICISSLVGLGFSSNRAFVAIICPEVQNPH